MRFIILSLIFIVSGCIDEAESNSAPKALVEATATAESPIITHQALPVTEDVCKNKIFPAATVHTNGHSYASICRLKQLTGIKIAGVDSLLLCESELFQEGFKGNGSHFSAEKVKALLGDAADKADILSSHGFIGKQFAVLLVGEGENTRTIATKEQLGTLDVTLETKEAALAWAYLSGVLGRGMGSGFAPEAMCGAELTQNGSGWLLASADVFQNCQPKEQRDISISKTGKVSILQKTVKKDSPALCID